MQFDIKKIIIYLIYTAFFFFVINPWFRYALFAVGVLLGWGLLAADQFKLYEFYSEEEELKKAEQDNRAPYLITRSTLFLFSLIPLGLFVVTSTGSALGGGMIMGLLLGLVLELWEYRPLPKLFQQRFLSQVNAQAGPQDIKRIVYAATAFFLFLNFLAIG